MALVAGALLVLADPDLRPAPVLEHLRGHRHARVAEQHVRLERLALVELDAVHDDVLAFADAILLATEIDDCVVHSGEKSQAQSPRSVGSVASPLDASSSTRRSPTGSSGCSPSRRRRSVRAPRASARRSGSSATGPRQAPRALRPPRPERPRPQLGDSPARARRPRPRSASATPTPVAAAVFFLRFLPPREPRRVFFFTGAGRRRVLGRRGRGPGRGSPGRRARRPARGSSVSTGASGAAASDTSLRSPPFVEAAAIAPPVPVAVRGLLLAVASTARAAARALLRRDRRVAVSAGLAPRRSPPRVGVLVLARPRARRRAPLPRRRRPRRRRSSCAMTGAWRGSASRPRPRRSAARRPARPA